MVRTADPTLLGLTGVVPAARLASVGFVGACSVNGIGSDIGFWKLNGRAQIENLMSRFDSCPDHDRVAQLVRAHG